MTDKFTTDHMAWIAGIVRHYRSDIETVLAGDGLVVVEKAEIERQKDTEIVGLKQSITLLEIALRSKALFATDDIERLQGELQAARDVIALFHAKYGHLGAENVA